MTKPPITCTLQAVGYQAEFELLSLDDEGYVHYELRFLLEPSLGTVELQSTALTIACRDFERLLVYLEGHISHLASNPNSEAQVFLEHELGFQLQAFSGGANDDGSEGSFTIRFLVNVGRAAEDASDDIGTSVYVGAESTISFSQVKHFVSCTRSALVNLKR
jgi:hypothetical protein